jgi:hypothetical protein
MQHPWCQQQQNHQPALEQQVAAAVTVGTWLLIFLVLVLQWAASFIPYPWPAVVVALLLGVLLSMRKVRSAVGMDKPTQQQRQQQVGRSSRESSLPLSGRSHPLGCGP